jgi:hypothetical protein
MHIAADRMKFQSLLSAPLFNSPDAALYSQLQQSSSIHPIDQVDAFSHHGLPKFTMLAFDDVSGENAAAAACGYFSDPDAQNNEFIFRVIGDEAGGVLS